MELRERQVRKNLEEAEKKELTAEEADRQRRQRQKNLSRQMSGRVLANDRTRELEATARLNIRQRKAAEQLRQEEYEHDLDRMYSRLESRPYLFERIGMQSARAAAERRAQDLAEGSDTVLEDEQLFVVAASESSFSETVSVPLSPISRCPGAHRLMRRSLSHWRAAT